MLTVRAEDFPFGVASATTYPTQGNDGYAADYNVAPQNTYAPVIFEAPLQLTNGEPQIWLAASGGEHWGGCEVWVSGDGDSYVRAGSIHQKARYGSLTAPLPAGAVYDNANRAEVQLLSGSLQGVSENDARDMLSACLVGNEFLAFADAELTGVGQYRLSKLVRGAWGSAPESHAAGTRFVRVDDALFRYPFSPEQMGKTVYIKLISFNVFGAALQELSDVPAYPYTIVGAPLGQVSNLRLTSEWAWGKQCALAWDKLDGADSYDVEVYAATSQTRLCLINGVVDNRYTYTLADMKADGGQVRDVVFKVRGRAITGKTGKWTQLVARNPQLKALQGIELESGLKQAFFKCAAPQEDDFAGLLLWVSEQADCPAVPENLAYDGADTFVVISKCKGQPLQGGKTYYIRAAGYDSFDKQQLNISSSHAFTVYEVNAIAKELSESNLAGSLKERIGKIDGNGAGSVNARIAEEAEARAAAVRQESQARTVAIRAEADKQTAALRAESGRLNTAIASAAEAAKQELAAQVAQLNAKDGELKQAQTALDGKAAELTRTAQQLGNRITAAETVNREQATAIQTVTAAQGRTAAALETEKTARAQGDAAEARARETLAATVGQHTAALSAERQARIDGDAANTRELNTAKSRIAEAVSSIGRLEQTVATNREAAAQETRELTARLNNLQVGGRNYVLASDRSTANYLTFAVSPDLTADKLRGRTLTVSCDIVCQGVQAGDRNRIGAEIAVEYADGTSAYIGAWRRNMHTAGDFKGRIKISLQLADKPVSRIVSMGIYNQTGGGTATVARPKLEIGNVATDWSPAPEDGATAAEAAITTEREARTTADRTQTAEITAAKSQIGNNKAAIDGIRSTKADKTEVAALARTSLASEWTAAAQTAKSQAIQAAAEAAQAKADAAQRAAEQAAERLATAKANAAQAAATAAASGDATAKANAAEAKAIVAAAAKDEAVKRAAAADAQTKADTAKAQAVAEANRLNAATNARVNTLEQTVSTQNSATATQLRNLSAAIDRDRAAASSSVSNERTARVNADNALTQQLNTAKSQIGTANSQITALQGTVAANHRAQTEQVNTLSAKLDNLQIGGRNYVLASDRSTSGSLSFSVSGDLPPETLRGQTLTVSCDIVCQGIQAGERNRIGAEITVEYADGSRAYVGAWRNNAHTAGNFKGRISGSLKLADKPVRQIHALGIYNQTGGGTATVARPKLEIGSVATDWSPAPEDVATSAQIQAVQSALAEKDRAHTQQIQTVQTTLNGVQSSVQTAAASVNGLKAQYTVKVDANGHVAGYGLASEPVNGRPRSKFIVQADQFGIGATGKSTAYPFVVDTRSNTVGVNGALVVNGKAIVDKLNAGDINGAKIAANSITANHLRARSISGDKLAVTTLSAISSNLGTVTAGSLNIGGRFVVNSDGRVRIGAPNNVGTVLEDRGVVVYNEQGHIMLILGRH